MAEDTSGLRVLLTQCNAPTSRHILAEVNVGDPHVKVRWVKGAPDGTKSGTGLARYGDGFIVGCGRAAFSRLWYVPDWALDGGGYIDLDLVKDIHGIHAEGDDVFIASTGTNQIIRFISPSWALDSSMDEEKVLWEGAQPDMDRIHLNDVWRGYGRTYYTAFGEDGNGVVGCLLGDKHRTLHAGLSQPHTVKARSKQAMFCDSLRSTFHRRDRKVKLKGYLRGWDYDKDYVVVGVSADREGSRPSTGNNKCGVFILDRDTLDVIKFVDLTFEMKEIFDIIIL